MPFQMLRLEFTHPGLVVEQKPEGTAVPSSSPGPMMSHQLPYHEGGLHFVYKSELFYTFKSAIYIVVLFTLNVLI